MGVRFCQRRGRARAASPVLFLLAACGISKPSTGPTPSDAVAGDSATIHDGPISSVADAPDASGVLDGANDGPNELDGSGDLGDAPIADAVPDIPAEIFTPCALTASGEPVYLDFSSNALWREMVVLDRGEPLGPQPRPVHLALHAMVDMKQDAEVHVADLHVPEVWPATLSLDHPETLVGPAAHSYPIAEVTPDGRTLAITYYGHPNGQPGGLQLLPIDVATWTPRAFVEVATGNWAVSRSLARGAGLEPGSAFAGQGFGIVWSVYNPDLGADEVRAAVLRASGAVSNGPWLMEPGSPTTAIPGTAAIWSGSHYLFAKMSFPCSGDDTSSCQPAIVSVMRVGGGAAQPSLQPATSFALESTRACCLKLAAYGGVVWAAWFEASGGDGSTLWSVRMIRLDSDGTALERPITVAAGTAAAGTLGLTANRNGAVVAWRESTSDGVLLQMRQFGPDGQTIGLPTTRNLGPRAITRDGFSVASIDNPPGILIEWAGSQESDTFLPGLQPGIFLMRLECRGS